VKVRVLKDCIVTPEAVEDSTRLMLVSGGSVQEIVGFSSVARQLARVLTKSDNCQFILLPP
jgi:alkylated DNA nucleotide flippase Atl1